MRGAGGGEAGIQPEVHHLGFGGCAGMLVSDLV